MAESAQPARRTAAPGDIVRVVLVGLRCSGKTTVGRLLASRLSWEFLDADEELVRREGRSIAEIFREDGEPAFRAIERRVLAELCRRERAVLAAGGGAVLDPENVRVMRDRALVVHLDARPEVLWERMRRDPVTGAQRPALTSSGGLEEMRTVAAARADLYAAARDVTVDTEALGPEEAAAAILDELARRGVSGEPHSAGPRRRA